MWRVIGVLIVTIIVICMTQWIRRWRNPKCNGILPPGSMGLPLIGETLHLMIPSYSLDLHPFIKNRIQKYGSIFKTSLVGRPIVISADPELNNLMFQQEGKLVEMWYMDTFSDIFKHEGESRTNEAGLVHKYVRTTFLNYFGADKIKQKLLPQIQQHITNTLNSWSNHDSVEIKHSASVMVLNFCAKQMISYDAEKSSDSLSDKYTRIIDGLMSIPLNIRGTAYNKCVKNQERVTTMLKGMIKERRMSPATRTGDFLDQMMNDMEKEKFLSEDFSVQLIFGGLFATFESVSAVITLAFKLLSEHPAVLQELMEEQNRILKNKQDPDSPLTWEEYKSMTFTLQVINETLRLGNVAPGLLRRALKDISYKGYTIPEGWPIMVVTSALQLSPNTFKDPLEFNPWRWKELESHVISKNFMPFGGGMRQCAGSEFSRVFIATFFYVLHTQYRWTKIKGGKVARNPILGFGKGIHVKFTEK